MEVVVETFFKFPRNEFRSKLWVHWDKMLVLYYAFSENYLNLIFDESKVEGRSSFGFRQMK